MKIKISIILICISLILIIFKIKNDNNDIKFHNRVISNIYDNHIEYKEYLGYIEIPKYNIKRLIKKGMSNKILDSNYVGYKKINDNLILLAGHNVNNVFHKIHYLDKNDLIYININKLITYKVIKKYEIKVDDYSILNKKYNNETIIIMTCTTNKNRRLIVIAKKV